MSWINRLIRISVLIAISTAALGTVAQQVPAAITADPPVDKVHPATMQSFQIPSHGEKMNALAYIPAGAGVHPVAIVFHGFPGNEKNLDLAQAIRRAGWVSVFFDYRGSWGTPGVFSFTHAREDSAAAVAFLRDPANAARLHADTKRIVLLGHSMGGYMAAHTGAHDPGILAVGLISAVNMHDWAQLGVNAADPKAGEAKLAERLAANQIASLAGCTADSLAKEMLDHRDDKGWNFVEYAGLFGTRPLLVISANDGLMPQTDRLIAAVRKNAGAQVTTVHFATDHSYSDQRIAMETAVLNWLAMLK
jgi:pimeloyl-ACP methyl ester carboxylesterase